ncbi:MAG TPA: aldo/keto reductase [Ktedonobacteraceae bacterium]|jgi:aryl-alcohol dehydrogenase-like predicted oxidoreductase
MATRKLGHSNLEVQALCLDGNVFGRIIDKPTSFPVLDAYVAAGGNFIDTADIYATGASETIIGRCMRQRGNRALIILATETGKPMARDNFEGPLAQVSRKQGIGVIPYVSLARGFLPGKYRRNQELPKSPRAEGVQNLYMNERGFAIPDAVDIVPPDTTPPRQHIPGVVTGSAWYYCPQR